MLQLALQMCTVTLLHAFVKRSSSPVSFVPSLPVTHHLLPTRLSPTLYDPHTLPYPIPCYPPSASVSAILPMPPMG